MKSVARYLRRNSRPALRHLTLTPVNLSTPQPEQVKQTTDTDPRQVLAG